MSFIIPAAVAIVVIVVVAVVIINKRRNPDHTIASGGAIEDLTNDKLSEIINARDPNTYLIDVRSTREYKSGTIPTSIHIPYQTIADNLPTDDKSARIIVYCQAGGRSDTAKNTLEQLGFKNVTNYGGIVDWDGELEYPEQEK